MKVAIDCQSPLLARSLEMFLAKHLSSMKLCDVIVTDKKMRYAKPSIYISSDSEADLLKPFSKSQLYLALENMLKAKKEIRDVKSILDEEVAQTSGNEPMNFDILEKRIDMLTKEYQANIIKAIKAFYEK